MIPHPGRLCQADSHCRVELDDAALGNYDSYMRRNGKLFVALHALVHLDRHGGVPMTSEAIAGCLSTNPVVVRRTLGELRRGGILGAVRGHGGGWTLARPAATITLLDICAALGESLVEVMEPDPAHPSCAVVGSLTDSLGGVLAEVRALLDDRLGRITLAGLSADVSTRTGVAGFHLPEFAHHGS